MCIYFLVGLIPGLVQELKAVVEERKPTMTLQWKVPSNIWNVKEVTSHEIRFKSSRQSASFPYPHKGSRQRQYNATPTQQKSEQYQYLPSLGSHCRDMTLGREQLKPLTEYDFEVRAVSSDGAGPWTAVTQYFCKYIFPCYTAYDI